MNLTKALLPFKDDGEYLATEHQWIVARAARISLERRIQQDTGLGAIANQRMWPLDEAMIKEYRERLGHAKVVERGVRDHSLDERLAVHRATPGSKVLGIDEICGQYDLTEDERVVLLLTCIVAITSRYAHEISNALDGMQHCSLTVDDCITLLEPGDVAEAMRARLLFRPEAPLVANSLIAVEVQPTHTTPTDILDARVSITFAALAVITGVPELTEAVWSHPTPAPETPATT